MSNEIEAAQIAADAAIHAAWVQGLLTLAAGGAAVIGGFLAYRGAVKAAARQVQLEEKRHEARVVAYRFRIEMILADVTTVSGVRLGEATSALRRYRMDPAFSVKMSVYPISVADDLLENHWEDHALLGQEVVRTIHELRTLLIQYQSFCNEVSQGDLQGNDFTRWPRRMKGSFVKNADGSVTLEECNVVETNEILIREIRDSVASFGAALAGSVSSIPGDQESTTIPPIIA